MAAHPRTARLTAAVLILLGFGCSEGPVTQPDDAGPAFAKGGGGGGVSVTAADPSFGKQGTIDFEVRVLGSGFDPGSQASWERDGAADPKIKVNSTTFVSTSELRANIDIAADAEIALYDVAVYTAGGRKGIGTEKFEVTAAVELGISGLGRGINDAGQVVGGSSEGAYFWDGERTVLGSSETAAWDVDQAGGVVVGLYNDGSAPLFWTRLSGGSWVQHTLTGIGGGGAARAVASHPVNGSAILIAGNVNTSPSKRERIPLKKPALWSGSGTAWGTPALLPLPAGFASGRAEDVSPTGIAVGLAGELFDVHHALVWETPGGVEVLQPLTPGGSGAAFAINPAGTVIVGESNQRAVFWMKEGVTWGPPRQLDQAGEICSGDKYSHATDVNDGGLVIGVHCEVATVWRISGGVVIDRFFLPGLGPSNRPRVEAVNNASQPLAAGAAGEHVVVWQLLP